MLLVVVLAFVAAALMVALVSLSPRRERLRVPHRTMVGLDRRRLQVQRRLRVTEALAYHERRLVQQRNELRLSLATKQPRCPATSGRGPTRPSASGAAFRCRCSRSPRTGRTGRPPRAGPAGYMGAAAPPAYMEPQARAS